MTRSPRSVRRMAALALAHVAFLVASVASPKAASAYEPQHTVLRSEIVSILGESCLYPVLKEQDTSLFTLNGVPNTAVPVPGTLRDDKHYEAANTFDTEFPNEFLKVGSNQVHFKSHADDFETDSYCLEGDDYVDIDVTITMSSAAIESRVLLYTDYYGTDAFEWSTEVPATLMELDPALAMDVANLEQALENYKANLVANASELRERDRAIAEKLDLITRLEDELSTLFQESFDDFTAAELAELLARYPELPKELTDELMQLVRDFHKRAADLRAELETLMDKFAEKADSVADLVTQDARADGWDPNKLDNYGTQIFGNDVPQVETPDLGSSSQFDPGADPYDQVASDVIGRLQSTLTDGRVADRALYAAIVRSWRTNQRAIEDIIRARATVNAQESAAFLRAQDKVLEFIRHHMDPNDWFVDVPVSPELKRLVDGVIRQRFAAYAQAIKDGVNLWTTRSTREQMVEDMTIGMGSVLENGYDQEPDEVKGVVTRVLGWASTAVQVGVGFTPLGDVLDACEAITGQTLCNPNGEKLATWERVAAGVGLVVGSRVAWQAIGNAVAGSREAAERLAKLAAAARREARFEELAQAATKNRLGPEVVLGKFKVGDVSYVEVAKQRGATYFQLDNWDEVVESVGEENVWNINAAFLRQQMKARKIFIFSHDPHDASTATGYFLKEVSFLIDAGYRFVKEGDVWRAIP